MTLYFVRHAKPEVDTSQPAAEWALSAAGRGAATDLGARLQVDAVWSSTERKAVETAMLLAPNTTPTQLVELGEVERPYVETDFEAAVARYLVGADEAGWEPRATVVARMTRAITQATSGADRAAIVTHGTALTTYFTSIGAISDAAAFWRELQLPAAFTIVDGEARPVE